MAFCPNCGSQLPEGVSFCPTCGQPLAAKTAGAAEVPVYPAEAAAGADQAQVEYPAPEGEKKPGSPGKKLIPVLIAAAVVVVAGLILILSLGQGGGKSGVDLTRRSAQRFYLDEDEAAYFPFPDGSCVKLEEKDGVTNAYLTPDGKRIVVLTQEGDLYLTDKSLKTKKKVESEVARISYLSDKGFLYTTEDDELFRYSFGSGSAVELTDDVDEINGLTSSRNGFGMLYILDDKLYRLPSEGKAAEKLTGVDGNCQLLLFSDDGKTVIWAESADNEVTFYSWEGKDKLKLGKLEGSSPRLLSSADQKLLVLYCSNSEVFLIWKKGKDPVKGKLSDGISAIRTAEGPLSRSSSGVKELYIQSGDALYRMTLNGEKTKLASGVQSFSIADGLILWLKQDGSLRCGKLGKDEIKNEEKLDKDVGSVNFSLNGRYAYYLKDTEKEDSVLYGYKLGSKAPVKIDDDVYTWRLSLSGDTVVYFTDVSGNSGDLRIADLGKESRKVAADVYRGSVESGYYYNIIDPNGFWFFKDIDANYGDLYYWNGKNAKKVAEGIDY